MREMRFPIKLRLSASGHLYSAIAVPSFALAVTQAASWRGVAGTQAGSLRYLHYCGPHTHIGAAAAKVPAQTRFQVLSFGMWILVQEGLARYHETGCAKAALLAVVINECLLQRMQLFALHQSLDRGDLFILGLDCQHRDRKSTRLNSSHLVISYAVFCLK